jgi:dual specificity protein kinase YAK1
MEGSGGTGGRREDAALPWRPSEATAFGRFAAAAAASLEPSPSASANGAAARVSSLHGVRRKPVWLVLNTLLCSSAPSNSW